MCVLESKQIHNMVESHDGHDGVIYFKKKNFKYLYNSNNGIKYEIDIVKDKHPEQFKNIITNKDIKNNEYICINCVDNFMMYVVKYSDILSHVNTYTKESIIPDKFDYDISNAHIMDIAYYWGV
jgi:hypothetical protein